MNIYSNHELYRFNNMTNENRMNENYRNMELAHRVESVINRKLNNYNVNTLKRAAGHIKLAATTKNYGTTREQMRNVESTLN